MWRNYGGSASYAIKLDPDTRLVPIIRKDGEERLKTELPVYTMVSNGEVALLPITGGVAQSRGWESVSYGEPSQAYIAFIDDCIQAADSKTSLSKHHGAKMFEEMELSALHKHSTFKEESEYRHLFRARPDNVFRNFRATRHGVVGYIEVGTVHPTQPERPGGFTDRLGKLPILEVRQGPFGHFDGAIHTLEGLLESCGHTSVTISQSESTYRE